MNKKLLSLIAASILSILTLTSCGGGGNSSQNTQGANTEGATSKSGSTTKIRFATWDSESNLALQQKIIDEFNSSQSNIQVTLEAYGDDFDTKISAGMGAKDAPDLMYMWNYPHYKDALEPLDDYIAKEGADFKNNYYEALLTYNSMDNKVLGMPVGYTTHAVYYNKDLFDKANVEYPKPGWTWDDLIATAKALNNPAENISGFAFSGKPDPYDFEMYLWSNGSSYCDKDGNTKDYLNSDKAVEVFTMFQNMLKDGYAITTEGSGATEMKSGKVAMFINGSWSIDSLKEANINFGLAELPSFKGQKPISIISTSGLSMSKDSKNKEAAWEVIKYWTSDKANKDRIDYELPVLKSVVSETKIDEDSTKGIFYKMLTQSQGYTPASFIVQNWSELSENLNLGFESIFNQTTYSDPKTTLDSMAE